MVFDWGFRCFSNIEGNITNKSIYAFSSLVGEHHEPQAINVKLFLPIIPNGIVAYALTLLWDNLCRNSCFWSNFGWVYDVITCLICIFLKLEYLWNKKRCLKKVNSIFLLMQATCLCFKMASIEKMRFSS